MKIVNHFLLDMLGDRQSGLPRRRRVAIEDLPDGLSVVMIHTNEKLGDAIIRSALFFDLRKSPKRTRHVVITTETFADYWKSHPCVDEVLVAPNREIDRSLKTTLRLRSFLLKYRSQFDVLIDFEHFCQVDEFYPVRLLNSKTNIGFSKEMFGLYDYSISNYADGYNLRTPAQRNRDILALFGVALDQTTYPVHIPVGFSGLKLDPEPRQKILLNAYGQTDNRSFSVEAIKRLCQEIATIRPDAHIYVSLPRNRSAYDGWNNSVSSLVTEVQPLKSQWELFDFINHMDAVITPDTGTAHIAAGLDKPLFVSFLNSFYYSQSWRPISDKLAFVCSKSERSVSDMDWDDVCRGLTHTLALLPSE